MRKNLGAKAILYPMPVLIIGTYDEDGKANAMNAAWGGISEETQISICVDDGHKTAKNVVKSGAFTVSIADVENIVACDYVGIVSGNKEPDKIEKTGWHVSKSELVDAPLFDELPLALECKLISYDEESCRLLGEIVNVCADESILDENGKIDLNKFSPITYDPVNRTYRKIGEVVGKAFSDGEKCGQLHLNYINSYIQSDCALFEFTPYDEGYAIVKYNGFDEEEIVIPSNYLGRPVVAICESSFRNCNELKKVIFTENIRDIQAAAFANCKELSNVILNDGLISIGRAAFIDCVSLEELDLPDSVTNIEQKAFENTSLVTLKIPRHICEIHRETFSKCQSLKRVILNEQITCIGQKCFSNCKSLEIINLPSTLVKIGDYAFQNCLNLKELKVMSNNVSIGRNVFCQTYVYRPDLRYNPRVMYKKLESIEIMCLPGSTMQMYCRENGIRCSKL